MIRIRCQCGKALKLPPEYVGKAASCPQCSKKVRVIAADLHPDAERFDGMLVIQEGPQRVGEQLYLGGRQAINVGKATDANLRLRSASVSRLHCRLLLGGQGWRVEDQNSTNGLFVNGRRIKGHNLLNGDILRVGEFELRYLSEPVHQPAAEQAAEQAAAQAFAIDPDDDDGMLHLLDDEAAMQQTATVPPPVPEPDSVWPAESDNIGFAEEDQVCPKCEKTFPMDARICVGCGVDLKTGLAITVGLATAEGVDKPKTGMGSYLKACVASFGFLADVGSLITFLIVGAIAALQVLVDFLAWGFMGLMVLFIIRGWISSFLFNVLLSAANGEKDLPDLALTGGWWDDICAPFFKFLGCGLLVMAPVTVYGIWSFNAAVSAAGGSFAVAAGAPVTWPDPLFYVLLGLGVFLWPITVLIMALGGVACFLRPDLIVRTILKSFIPYVVACAMTGLAVGLTFFLTFMLAGLTWLRVSPMFAEVILWIGSTYCWIVAMRCIGLYYHHFKSRFAWSWG